MEEDTYDTYDTFLTENARANQEYEDSRAPIEAQITELREKISVAIPNIVEIKKSEIDALSEIILIKRRLDRLAAAVARMKEESESGVLINRKRVLGNKSNIREISKLRTHYFKQIA